MKREWVRGIAALLLVSALVMAGYFLKGHLPDIEQVKAHKEQLLSFIRVHYLEAVFGFIGLYLGSALFLPGALVLSIAGGLMFGVLPAALYLNIGATVGAVLAFMASRFLLHDWIQQKFRRQLERFNREMERHGPNYLLVLRMVPVLPFFVVNYGAGLSKVPLKTFVWTTSVGIIPGSLIHTYIGYELRSVNAPAELVSWKILLALALISLVALYPVLRHHLQRRK